MLLCYINIIFTILGATISRVLSWVVIYLDLLLPTGSSEALFALRHSKSYYHMLLAADRVYLAEYVTIPTGGLLHHPFTLYHRRFSCKRNKVPFALLSLKLYAYWKELKLWFSTLCCTCPRITPAIR